MSLSRAVVVVVSCCCCIFVLLSCVVLCCFLVLVLLLFLVLLLCVAVVRCLIRVLCRCLLSPCLLHAALSQRAAAAPCSCCLCCDCLITLFFGVVFPVRMRAPVPAHSLLRAVSPHMSEGLEAALSKFVDCITVGANPRFSKEDKIALYGEVRTLFPELPLLCG